MRKTRTFKAGEHVDSLAQFAKLAADELTGDTGFAVLAANVKITVETTQTVDLATGPLLESLDLGGAKDDVHRFIQYRSEELHKPLRSIAALKRLLKPFAGNVSQLSESIANTMRQGWTGLFGADQGKSRRDRSGGEPGVF